VTSEQNTHLLECSPLTENQSPNQQNTKWMETTQDSNVKDTPKKIQKRTKTYKRSATHKTTLHHKDSK
jgi:hypothetical protein